ncbi:MAG: hypothetical protein DWQ31_21360 [Planctomycetota bacterium]|nr:MAG: hypothetical protein DWQ31_21360 [Planctomycetota bacterium]REJ93654.1 MAG: hypothetical protein DWQ35_09895 [Planctomycetota bacterium]REK25703.1 MAG: hypothetical protein DWQ42_10635 [Planctomycetota bacterium]REK46551.1 MAG: hypothetical protein DWQ46_06670 [Planctomycetota bacterium]
MSETPIGDLKLRHDGVLEGVLIGRDGVPRTGELVGLRRQGQPHASATTDKLGRFYVAGLPGGVYEFVCDGYRGVFRIWPDDAAPPSARPRLLIMSETSVTRGQQEWGPWLGKPTVFSASAIAGAAVAPIVVINERRTSS